MDTKLCPRQITQPWICWDPFTKPSLPLDVPRAPYVVITSVCYGVRSRVKGQPDPRSPPT